MRVCICARATACTPIALEQTQSTDIFVHSLTHHCLRYIGRNETEGTHTNLLSSKHTHALLTHTTPLRYIGRKWDLNGRNEKEVVTNDMAGEAVESLINKYLTLIYQDQLVRREGDN